MRTLLSGGMIVDVFTGEVRRSDVLMGGGTILGVGEYEARDADSVRDVSGCALCPGFIDGHIHIESTMLLPAEFARACLPHGTTAVVADPHEIANVSGTAGIEFMLEASRGLPVDIYLQLPSCVPATRFDEAGAALPAEALRPFYENPRVIGLGEVMNYPGVIAGEPDLLRKIADAKGAGRIVSGHAPLLSGRALDRYLAAGISDDHECSSAQEAMERIRRGQRVMIRQGTAARNLRALLPLFEAPWASRCLLVTDDRHPADLLAHGHIDSIIREAAQAGKSAVTGIRMATLQAAEHFGLRRRGAIAPGYAADIAVLSDLESVLVREVYKGGELAAEGGYALPFDAPPVDAAVLGTVRGSFRMDALRAEDFRIEPVAGSRCRVIRLTPGQLLTEEALLELDFSRGNGVDPHRDILKLAVLERHLNTGHRGLGFIQGLGMRRGAIASSVSHDAHNLIVIGATDADMAAAANRVREMGGGCAVVLEGNVLADMPLPVAGLMSDAPAEALAKQNQRLREEARALGARDRAEPFMTMAFLSLPVIPHIKMTTRGLVDVDRQVLLPLYIPRQT